MTTPLGVPNLPIGALTVETLGEILQDMSAAAMRQRAGDRFPDIFNLSTGGDVLNDLTPFGILTSIWAQFNSIMANADPEDVQGPEDIPDLILRFIEEIPLIGILVKFVEALGFTPEAVEEFLQPIFEFLNWLWDLVGQEAETILKPIFEFLNWLFNEYGDDVETFLKPIADFLKWVLDFIIDRIDLAPFQALVEQLVDALGGFLSAQQFVDLLKTVLQFFSGLFVDADGFTASVTAFINNLPLIGPIVSAITGKTEADGVALDLGTLSAYFRSLDKQVTDGVAGLVAAAQKLLGGVIPVGQISDTTVNLLSQGDFLTSSTVDPAGGWTWDATRTRTGTGGSLTVACTGSSQRIYCKQDIKVAEGDRLTLSGYVGTSGFTSGSMQLSIVPWGLSGGVMTAGTIQNGTARTTSASTFQALSNLTYTVPAGVTSIQVSLVVNCNTGCSVFFDDIKLTKTGVLPQGLVTNLLDAIQGILNGAGYVANQGWQFLETAIGFVTADANDALNNTEDTNTVLFDNPAGGTRETATQILGAGINPGVGSGALMTRTTTTPVSASGGRNGFSVHSGFFNNGSSTSDISANTTTATFTVVNAGWYLAEISFRLGTAGTAGFNAAPLLYKNGSPHKIGSDGIQTATRTSRYSQSSFIVYLTAGQTLSAGYDVDATTATPQFIADASGVETYFSVSLLNKSFA
ncbi:hypothetical protein [Mycolicibacterium sp.]|uniref:hypothetical protein n=1 Tax=Mycolicibacterium sp. TaxID=2320850 RepID=UPI0028A67296|nr:hypothetical protein [Mycolicibacterium sp.]